MKLPTQFTFPFHYTPHPLSVQATREVQQYVATHSKLATELSCGKMLGVLVVMAPGASRPQFLAAFSGNLCGSNDIPYFVPAVYDLLDPNGEFKQGEAAITSLNHRIAIMSNSPSIVKRREQLATVAAHGRIEIEEFKKHIARAKVQRDHVRATTQVNAEDNERMLNESRFLKAELKRLRQRIASEVNTLQGEIEAHENQITTLKSQRKAMSEALQERIFGLFKVENANGDTSDLTSIFAHAQGKLPPAGSGECCAPKLLHYAFTHHLTPLCMAEFWYGASPVGEVRHHGHFYPACRSKCKPILEYMLQGLNVESNTLAAPTTSKGIEVIFDDPWLAVVNKPSGMLSVPGKLISASALTQFAHLYPKAAGPMVVHRLDQETSGLLVFAKDKATHKALQAQFASHTIVKQYIAVLDREIESDEGIIDLPLCPNVDDRPRQMVSHEHGRPAITRYKVVERHKGTTRIEFYPLTGRTHQLRVHASHPQGLNAPIVGDRLYGTAATRLMLHAQRITFTHPVTGQRLTLTALPPDQDNQSMFF